MKHTSVYLLDSGYIHGNEQTTILDFSPPLIVHEVSDLRNSLMVKRGLDYAPQKLLSMCLNNFQNEQPSSDCRRAFILASGNTKFSGNNFHKPLEGTTFDIACRIPYRMLTQIYAGTVAHEMGFEDLVITDSSACASSGKAVYDAMTLINSGQYDEVAVVAVEDQICFGVASFFTSLNACLTLADFEKGILPSAFDDLNSGFILGRGVAYAIFASESFVHQKGLSPKAKILSASIASEHASTTLAPRSDGQGYKRAISGALQGAQVNTKDIDIVKTHGTGTAANNIAERNALIDIFGDKFTATGYKQQFGHTLGVSGLLEILVMIKEVKNGVISPFLNRTRKDKNFIDEPHTKKVNKFLALSSGMGNIYSAVLCEPL